MVGLDAAGKTTILYVHRPCILSPRPPSRSFVSGRVVADRRSSFALRSSLRYK